MFATPAQAGNIATADVSGSCQYDGVGGSFDAEVRVADFPWVWVFTPDGDDASEAAEACAQAPRNLDTPDEGSHATVTVEAVGGQSVTVSTVPVTDALPTVPECNAEATVLPPDASAQCQRSGFGGLP